MLAINPQVKIYLHTEPIDMRKSFDGFLNLLRNRIKLMYWCRDGIAIWMKKQKPEDTHFDIFTEVRFGRTFKGIVDETRSTHF
jgi:hypothetical protein